MGKVIGFLEWLCPEIKKQRVELLARADHYVKRLGEAESLVLKQAEEIRQLRLRVDALEHVEAPKVVRAKTAAQVRQFMEQQNEREFEESVKNGI